MKTRKPKATEPSLIDELNKPLRDFVSDFQEHGADALQKVRENNPEKYLELSTKLLPLVPALNPGQSDFSECKSMEEIGIKLLKAVGMDEYLMDENAVKAALECNNAFIAKLEAIRDAAQEPMQ